MDLRGGRLGDLTGLVLTADRVDTCNDTERPDAVTPQPLDLLAEGDLVRVTIPPHAFVTVRGTLS